MTRKGTGTTGGTDGLLLVDKPAGISSHDVVLAARRRFGEPRIGHGGTLDPFATGLLVLLTGRATRLLRYLNDVPKVYVADICFGSETDTEDPLGTVVREAGLPERSAIDAAVLGLTGRILQTPSAFSAKRIDGQRAYHKARAGEAVDLAPVEVDIGSLTIESAVAERGRVAACRIHVSCGSGTYVRALARDLGRAAGSAAHLTTLRRERAGVFSIAQSIPLDRLVAGEGAIAPAIHALAGHPVQQLSEEEVGRVARGIDVEARIDGPCAALIEERGTGALVAFAERRPSEKGDRWQPRVVMREPT